MVWVKSKIACQQLGVSANGLRLWDAQKKIKTIRTPGGNRLYDVESFTGRAVAANGSDPATEHPLCERVDIAYCRVSSAKQKQDLERQVAFMQEKYPQAEIVTDVGSGINFKRKGIRSVLERALQGSVRSVTVAHRDRLCRFGFELIQWLLERQQVKLVVLDDEQATPETDFTEDLLAIVTVFSARFNGMRRYRQAAQEAVEGRPDQGGQRAKGSTKRRRTDQDAQAADAPDQAAEEAADGVDGQCAVHVQQVPRGCKARRLSSEPEPAAAAVCEQDAPPAKCVEGGPVCGQAQL